MVPGAQEVILAAIRDEGGAFEYASEDLKNDYDFALEVVAMGGPGGDGEGRKPRQASHANDHQCWCWIGIAVPPGGFQVTLPYSSIRTWRLYL